MELVSSLPWLTYISFLLAGAAKAFSDLYSEGILKPTKDESWKFKWKLNDHGKIITNNKRLWYYLWLWKPKYVERFPYSSEFLVFLTDPWHLFNTIRMVFTIAGVLLFSATLHPVLEFFIIYGFFAAGFTPTYRYLKYRKK